MVINEAYWDRTVRIVIGLVLLALAFTGPRTYWGLLGLLPLLTGLVGFCPIYKLLGFNTFLHVKGGGPKPTA